MIANYPRDCWYVAAVTGEIGRVPLSRRLLDRPVVLYRQESGQIVALADQCGHRGYPLSKGRLNGDNIECGYHGFQYDPTGACVKVPSQPSPPYGACVARYPIREIGPFVWIWLGEPGRENTRAVPALPWLTGQGWASSGTTLRVNANYMLVHEHYLDLTHIPWVHPQETPPTIGRVAPLDEIQVSETSVTFSRKLPEAPLADWEAVATGLPRDRAHRRRHYGTFISPAVLAEGWDVFGADGQVFGQVRIQAVTPETPSSTHLFWQFCRNYRLDDDHVAQHLHAVFEQVMRVDIDVVETIQSNVGYQGAADGFRVSADAGVLKVRRIVESMLAQEHRYRSPLSAVAAQA
jgi:phenylpropionate dioxygenase-like ring-hydroxylating dioxygenase large terminal subunit